MLVRHPMAYRDEIDKVVRESDEIRTALAKARADARFTALRQVLLAFAFGLSWSVLDDDAIASTAAMWDHCVAPPVGYGWLQITPGPGSRYVLDQTIHGEGAMKLALRPGTHRVVFRGPFGEHCSTIRVRDGRTAYAYDDVQRVCE